MGGKTVKRVFKLENVKGKEFSEEFPKKFPKKKITGNTRNSALREMLQTTAKVTKTSVPTKLNRIGQKIMQIIKDGKPASFGKDCEEIINTGLLGGCDHETSQDHCSRTARR
jgi:hypothetical protein